MKKRIILLKSNSKIATPFQGCKRKNNIFFLLLMQITICLIILCDIFYPKNGSSSEVNCQLSIILSVNRDLVSLIYIYPWFLFLQRSNIHIYLKTDDICAGTRVYTMLESMRGIITRWRMHHTTSYFPGQQKSRNIEEAPFFLLL